MFVQYNFQTEPNWVTRLKKAFTDYFGEDRVGIVKSNNATGDGAQAGKPYLVVHFPSVTIHRYRGGHEENTHPISDLFMFIMLDLEHNNLHGELKGFRTTYTLSEIVSGYCHSHLQSINRSSCHKLHHFCTGSGDINSTLGNLSSVNIDRIDDEFLTLLAFQLDLLVAVESHEGVPYVSMSTISNKNVGARYVNNTIYREPGALNNLEKRFIKYLADNKFFSFNRYRNILFHARDIISTAREMSVKFIEFLADENLPGYTINDLITEYFSEFKIENMSIVCLNDTSYDNNGLPVDSDVIDLNGNVFKLKLIPDLTATNNRLCLNVNFVNKVYSHVFNFVNYNYGAEELQRIKEERL